MGKAQAPLQWRLPDDSTAAAYPGHEVLMTVAVCALTLRHSKSSRDPRYQQHLIPADIVKIFETYVKKRDKNAPRVKAKFETPSTP